MKIGNVISRVFMAANVLKLTIILSISLVALSAFAEKIPVRDLFANPQISHIQLSPNGNLIASQTRKSGKRYVTIFESATLKSYKKLMLADDEILRKLRWVDNDTVYIDIGRRNNSRWMGGFIDLDLSQLDELVEFKKIKGAGTIIDFLPDENDVVLFSKDTGKYVTDLRIYKATVEQLMAAPGFKQKIKGATEPFDYKSDAIGYFRSSTSRTLFAMTYDKGKKRTSQWYQLEGNDDWHHLYTWKNGELSFRPYGYLGDNKFLVLTNKTTDTLSAVRFNAVTQKIEEVLYQHEKYDLNSASMNSNNSALASVSYYEHGNLKSEFLNETGLALSQYIQAELDGKKWYVVSLSDNHQSAVIQAYGPQDSGAYYLLSHLSKTPSKHENSASSERENSTPSLMAEPLSSDKPPQLRLLSTIMDYEQDYLFAKTQTYSLPTSDGDEIEVLLTEPNINDNNVLLVMPHGGPIGVRDHGWFNENVQFLANRGYTVLRVNFRGSSGFGKRFEKKGRAQFGKLIEQDIMLAVNDLIQKKTFKHLCSIGNSYGGYSALMLTIQNPGLFSCAVGGYGVYDLPLLFNASNRKMNKQYIRAVTRTVGKNSEDLKQVSPVYLADKVNVPVLLIAGKKDQVATFEHSNRLKYVLEKLNKPVETIFYKDVGHGHRTWGGEWHEMAIIDSFLRKTLALPSILDEKADMQEYVAMADYYEGDRLIGDLEHLALKYYRLAAELGHERSMFNVGAYYHQGEEVEKDLNIAKEWYEKASEAGYANASYRLGYLLMRGDYQPKPSLIENTNKALPKANVVGSMKLSSLGEELQKEAELRREHIHHYTMKTSNHADQAQAVTYFETALEQGADAEAQVHLGYAYCMGLGVEKDVEKCVELLKLESHAQDKKKNLANPVTRDSYLERRLLIPTLMIEGTYTDAEYDKLNELLISVRKYEEVPFQLDNVDHGTFGPFHYKFPYQHLDTVTQIPFIYDEEEEVRFGVKFEMESEHSDYEGNVAVLTRWSKKLEGESAFVVEDERLTIRHINYEFPVLRLLTEDDEVGTEWRVEVFSTRGERLYQKEFVIVKG